MSDHKPECVLSDPCYIDSPAHGFCGNSDFSWCVHCEQQCDCERIKRAEDRVRAEHDEYRAMLGGIEIGAERSWDYALDAAREAVAALSAPYKVRGKYETYDSYHQGKADMQDLAVDAIDALREKK